MSVAALLTRGLGSYSTSALLLTRGLGIGEATTVPGCPDEFRTVVTWPSQPDPFRTLVTASMDATSADDDVDPYRTRVTLE